MTLPTRTPPLDAWSRYDNPDDEIPDYEANTYRQDYPDGATLYRVEWSHADVGQIVTHTFGTYEDACIWYEENGYTPA